MSLEEEISFHMSRVQGCVDAAEPSVTSSEESLSRTKKRQHKQDSSQGDVGLRYENAVRYSDSKITEGISSMSQGNHRSKRCKSLVSESASISETDYETQNYHECPKNKNLFHDDFSAFRF